MVANENSAHYSGGEDSSVWGGDDKECRLRDRAAAAARRAIGGGQPSKGMQFPEKLMGPWGAVVTPTATPTAAAVAVAPRWYRARHRALVFDESDDEMEEA